MDTLPEIEAAVDALPVTQRKELSRRLAERLRGQAEPKRQLLHVAPTGNPITQEEIDDALDAD
jgi:hypothetical protein